MMLRVNLLGVSGCLTVLAQSLIVASSQKGLTVTIHHAYKLMFTRDLAVKFQECLCSNKDICTIIYDSSGSVDYRVTDVEDVDKISNEPSDPPLYICEKFKFVYSTRVACRLSDAEDNKCTPSVCSAIFRITDFADSCLCINIEWESYNVTYSGEAVPTLGQCSTQKFFSTGQAAFKAASTKTTRQSNEKTTSRSSETTRYFKSEKTTKASSVVWTSYKSSPVIDIGISSGEYMLFSKGTTNSPSTGLTWTSQRSRTASDKGISQESNGEYLSEETPNSPSIDLTRTSQQSPTISDEGISQESNGEYLSKETPNSTSISSTSQNPSSVSDIGDSKGSYGKYFNEKTTVMPSTELTWTSKESTTMSDIRNFQQSKSEGQATVIGASLGSALVIVIIIATVALNVIWRKKLSAEQNVGKFPVSQPSSYEPPQTLSNGSQGGANTDEEDNYGYAEYVAPGSTYYEIGDNGELAACRVEDPHQSTKNNLPLNSVVKAAGDMTGSDDDSYSKSYASKNVPNNSPPTYDMASHRFDDNENEKERIPKKAFSCGGVSSGKELAHSLAKPISAEGANSYDGHLFSSTITRDVNSSSNDYFELMAMEEGESSVEEDMEDIICGVDV